MKVSEMIRNLKVFMYEHGDIDCWFVEDDEGNGYQPVCFEPSLYYVNKYHEVFTEQDWDASDDDERADLTPICIVN